MSIRLVVEDYCRQCEDFVPTSDSVYGNDHVLETSVYCIHRDICHRLECRLAMENAVQKVDGGSRSCQ